MRRALDDHRPAGRVPPLWIWLLATAIAVFAAAGAGAGGPGGEPDLEAARFFERALAREREGDPAGAIIELKNALQREPEMLAAWVELSEIYLSIGDAADAAAAIERADALGADAELTLIPRARAYLLSGELDALLAARAPAGIDPEKAVALAIIQGKALLQAHRLREAAERFERLRATAPRRPEPLWGLAQIAQRSGRLEAARAHLDAAMAMAPDEAETWYLRGNLRRVMNAPQAALADFSRAVALEPGHLPARLGRAALRLDAGELAPALADLETVLEANPDSFQGLYLASMAEAMRGDQAAANTYLQRARELLSRLPSELVDDNLPALLISAVLALRDGEANLAADKLERYRRRAPAAKGAKRLLALALLRAGEPYEAKLLLRELLVVFPNDLYLGYLLASAHARLGEQAEALALLEQVSAEGLRSPRVRMQLGLARLASGRRQSALQELEAAALASEGLSPAGLFMAAVHIEAGRPEKALAAVEAMLARAPDNPALNNFAGAVKLMLGEAAAARARFERALAADAEYLPAKLNLAEMARQAGRLDAAESAYREILRLRVKSIPALRGLAEIALQRRAFAEAVRHLARIKRIDRDLLADRLALAKAHLAAGQPEHAQVELRELRGEHEANWRVLLMSAGVEHVLSNHAVARAFVRQAATAADSPASFAQVAQAYHEQDLPERAAATLRTALQAWPQSLALRRELASVLVRLGRYESALEQAGALGELAPGRADAALALGEIHAARGDDEGALAAYERALDREASLLAAMIGKSRALLGLGRAEDAVAAFRRWRERHDAGGVESALAFAGLLLRTDRQREAAAQYDQVLARDPDNREALNNRAWLAQTLGEPEAIELARRAASQWPRDAAVLDTAGWIMLENGELEQALWYLRDALAREADEPRIQLHLAAALAASGEREQAGALLREVLAMPAFTGRDEALALLEQIDGPAGALAGPAARRP